MSRSGARSAHLGGGGVVLLCEQGKQVEIQAVGTDTSLSSPTSTTSKETRHHYFIPITNPAKLTTNQYRKHGQGWYVLQPFLRFYWPIGC